MGGERLRRNMALNRLESGEDQIDSPMEDRDLRVVLEIDRGGPCRLDSLEGDILGLDVRLGEDVCNVDAVVRDPADETVSTRFFENPLCGHCPGRVFAEYGCLPRYKEIEKGSFVVETYVYDTEVVADLVRDIRAVCESVSLTCITSTDTTDFQERASIDMSALTSKQREAVAHAQQLGYYDADSDVSLAQLADRIGISTSALSQRLQRAQGNVLRQLSCECSCWCDAD
jgi:predicted DNA binding protein